MMKLTYFLLILVSTVTAQSKKINFFGTEFALNNACIVKESSARYDKNAMIWMDAPPKLMRSTMVSMIKSKFKENNIKEVKNDAFKVTLLKNSWEGRLSAFKKEDNDSITNCVELYGHYKEEERLLILIYKTARLEAFRIPAYFDFLVK